MIKDHVNNFQFGCLIQMNLVMSLRTSGHIERKNKMDIPIHAKVICQNQECGKTTCIIINPINKLITHIVVKENGLIGIERLIPVENIFESQAGQITLRCSQKELSNYESFIESHYIGGDEQYLDYPADQYYYHPYLTQAFNEDFEYEPLIEQIERIPPGELGIHRGTVVYASNGKVGKVTEFIISPVDNKISHLVLKEGHLWGEKLVTIPVSAFKRIITDRVYLKLSKEDIEKLPVIPVKQCFICDISIDLSEGLNSVVLLPYRLRRKSKEIQ
jgi:hypothetical protein